MIKSILNMAFVYILYLSIGMQGAQAKTLSKDDVIEFVHQATRLANDVKQGGDVEQATQFFTLHLHPKAHFTSVIKFLISGYPEQTQKLSLNKDEYLENLINSNEQVVDYEASVQIESVKLSSDKRKATVKVLSEERGTSLVPTENGGVVESVPVTGRSVCNEIIMLNSDDVMQLYSAVCKTNMSFE